MKTFEASDTRELKIDDGSFHLYLSKNQQANAKTDLSPQPSHAEPVRPVAAASTQQIKAPLVGTVYLQAKPEQPAYVKVGSQVHKGDVVCIIEAMKMEIPVVAPQDGTVASIDVAEGASVENGDTLATMN